MRKILVSDISFVNEERSGYNVGEMDWGKQCEILNVGFDFNNWGKSKD